MADNTMSAYVPRMTYEDGSQVVLSNEAPYSAIDRDRLRAFEIINRETGQVGVRVNILPEQRLIWRSRTFWTNGQNFYYHVIGKQQTVDGKNIQGIVLFREEDGSIEIAERFDEKSVFMRPIEAVPGETWVN